jgi:hypothetical protein
MKAPEDPRRLWAGGSLTDLEHRLLESANHEQMPAELKRRLERALGIGTAVAVTAASVAPAATAAAAVSGAPAAAGPAAGGAAAAATAAAAAAPAAAVTVKAGAIAWFSVGILALAFGGGALGAHLFARPAVTPPRPAAAEAVTTRAPAEAEAAVAPAPAPQLGAAARQSRGPSGSAVSRAGQSGDLRSEIALIDAARAALRARAPVRALELLGRYSARHPRGTLKPEAAVLRIEALDRSGAHQRARALAREFLAAYPDSPLGERAALVLAHFDEGDGR